MLQKKKDYEEKYIHTWDDLIKHERKHRNNFKETSKETEWIFRGHDDSKWRLQTTLERVIGNIGGIKDNNEYYKKLSELLNKGLNGQSIFDIESGLIRKFRRHSHHYDIKTPKERDVIEWLALMQHYGAPTRLLDWTYSFNVAVFFAIEQAGDNCAVWALEKLAIRNNRPSEFKKILSNDADADVEKCKTWKKVFKRKKPISFVYPVNPFRLNERLIIQQGDFLCPGDISKPFEDNLAVVLRRAHKTDPHNKKLFKYIIKFDAKERQEILLNLHRMNINRASLFPGLEGFAKSLKTLLVSPKNLLKPVADCEDKKV